MAVTSATLLERPSEPREATAWGRLNDLDSPLIRGWVVKETL